jgi:sucrose phosphorylase
MTSEKNPLKNTQRLLERIYDKETALIAFAGIEKLVDKYRDKIQQFPNAKEFDQSDVILITYGDMVQKEGEKPLKTLRKFLNEKATGLINSVHVLPFYPYSSDDGFSVIDYREVDPDLGDWEDIAKLGNDFKLMVDLVANHVSAESGWFRKYKQGLAPFKTYFIEVEPGTDLSKVFRPRALPLLKTVETNDGEKQVWTTFSQDQIDLNYANYQVLLEVIDILLLYIEKTAKYIRLDAIAYIWKEIGTCCIHLMEAHWIVQIMRNILDFIAPFGKLITETNVPHKENVSYFGDGTNEAEMVYNFSLPPLILHAFHTQNANYLTQWADEVIVPSEHVAFFNFLASHDGIGVMPLRGILENDEILELAHRIEKLGGYVSFKTNSDGSESPYELNINFFDALDNPDIISKDEETQIQKFVCAHGVIFSLKGVPGIYFHSLFGSTGWPEGVEKSGQKRKINREKLKLNNLISELKNENSRRARIFSKLSTLLEVRRQNKAFNPQSRQYILDIDERLFCLLRYQDNFKEMLLCIHNFYPETINKSFDSSALKIDCQEKVNILYGSGNVSRDGKNLEFSIPPYDVLWAKLS